MAKSVDLTSISFKTKTAAIDFFQSMLNRYKPGDVIDPIDAVHLSQLFKRHLDYDRKKGGGIDHFEVMRGEYNSQCFGIVRIDGTEENFSYRHCVTQIPRAI